MSKKPKVAFPQIRVTPDAKRAVETHATATGLKAPYAARDLILNRKQRRGQ
jgi:hypothetical protein